MNTLAKEPYPSKLYVKKQSLKLSLGPEGFQLFHGGVLEEVVVAFETYGQLNHEKSNAILVCTPLTMDAHAAGWYTDYDLEPGWWDDIIGPGKAFDTNRYFVIASNILGGCQGTTGPASLNPKTGQPYGSSFPIITIQDMVRVQYHLVRQLGIESLFAVVGGSMGGMQALEWSVAYPESLKKCICIAASHQLSPQALGFEIIGRKIVINDPHYHEGNYHLHDQGPFKGLAFARMIGLLTYLSAESMKKKFKREQKPGYRESSFETGFEVEGYLNHNAHKFTERFDANSYLYVTYAMDTYDLENTHGNLQNAFTKSKCDFLLVALSSDWLFRPEQSRQLANTLLELGKIVSLVELESPYGHDAFLLEVGHLGKVMESFLENALDPQKGSRQEALNIPNANSSSNQDSSAYTAVGSNLKTLQKFKRREYIEIEKLIEPCSHILDIGCGGGTLIHYLYHKHKITGFGIEIYLPKIIQCLEKNVPVLHLDADEGLPLFGDKSFDYAVLSLTLQALKNPQVVLTEMLRVAQKGIVIFSNIGAWNNRFRFLVSGRVPNNSLKGEKWWTSPDIRQFSYRDFVDLCAELNISIEKTIPISGKFTSKLFGPLGFANLGADFFVVKIASKNSP